MRRRANGVRRVLPVYPLAPVIGAGVTSGIVHNLGTSWAVLAAWTAAAWAATGWVVGRRG